MTTQPIAVEFAKGRRFRVVADGVTATGMKPDHRWPNTFGGWSAPLPPGTIVTSRGYGPGWGSDPGHGVHWDVPGAEGIVFIEIRPMTGSMWTYRPAPGVLEPVDD